MGRADIGLDPLEGEGQDAADPEVGQLDIEFVRDEHVFGFDIAVDYFLFVDVVEGA